ncbi:hypothetical protein MSG28_000050 [Choristoneura fumiferana]|uniref:Uncharacterized protein n=1 Tax=Choristoneura fumiferana TaxID=7141 RepID=A0ACC0JZJ0_CHOFU|nr:hypothetical protein MSG28_000050 [Choristoneura fumiferana]
MSVSKTVRNVSYEQMKVMLDFMSQHVDFATGSLRSLEGRHTARQLWRDLTLILNNCQTGARKTVEKWSNRLQEQIKKQSPTIEGEEFTWLTREADTGPYQDGEESTDHPWAKLCGEMSDSSFNPTE